jgi:hypothetical protein
MAVVWAGRVWVLEATRHGVWPIPLSNKAQDFGWIPCGHLGPVDLDRAFSIIGDGYGWEDAVAGDAGTLKIGLDHLWQCAEAFLWWRKISDCQATPDAVADYLLRGAVAMTEVQL